MDIACSQNGSRSAFKIRTGTPIGKRHLESLGVDGRTILEGILNKCQWEELDWFVSGQGLLSLCLCEIESPSSVSHWSYEYLA